MTFSSAFAIANTNLCIDALNKNTNNESIISNYNWNFNFSSLSQNVVELSKLNLLGYWGGHLNKNLDVRANVTDTGIIEINKYKHDSLNPNIIQNLQFHLLPIDEIKVFKSRTKSKVWLVALRNDQYEIIEIDKEHGLKKLNNEKLPSDFLISIALQSPRGPLLAKVKITKIEYYQEAKGGAYVTYEWKEKNYLGTKRVSTTISNFENNSQLEELMRKIGKDSIFDIIGYSKVILKPSNSNLLKSILNDDSKSNAQIRPELLFDKISLALANGNIPDLSEFSKSEISETLALIENQKLQLIDAVNVLSNGKYQLIPLTESEVQQIKLRAMNHNLLKLIPVNSENNKKIVIDINNMVFFEQD